MATASALPQPAIDALGSCLVAAGAIAALVRRRRGPESEPLRPATPAALIDPAFLALRDTLGAAWALRIAERFDTVAGERGWPCRLRFAGLAAGGDPADASWHRDAPPLRRRSLARTSWMEGFAPLNPSRWPRQRGRGRLLHSTRPMERRR
ncbi:MAG: hypothetical protein EBR28_09105 [Planctomycetia bacterium]|nr:hypothetical protein [Planctomycetia bacterium]